MRDGASLPTIYREDYQPPAANISAIRLDFRLGLTETILDSEFDFQPRPTQPSPFPLELAGDELEFQAAWLDGRPLRADEFAVSPSHFVLKAAHSGCLRIRTRLVPTENTELMGLYASRGGLYTQCESEGFRRMAYFLDRPDVLTVYTVTLRARRIELPVLLSNGNLIEQRFDGEAEAWQVCVWHDPFPKPSYLFALVAADLQKVEKTVLSRSGAPKCLQVFTRQEDLGRAEFALESLERAMRWDESRFGLELDLERFMIVAVPDFNSGAMENKGLNLFNTKFVLADADTATDRDHELVEAVIGHEYFHNWTGNRITCRDWFQLTLKEGLTVFRDQEFTADMLAMGLDVAQAASSRAVKRIDDVRMLRAHQFPEDAGPMAHPIRPDHYQEIRNFYTATVYEKGAEVIRMLQTILGRDRFRQGMDRYIGQHDGEAATCEDFVSSMLSANDRDDLFSAFMRWYDTLGTPRLEARDEWHPEQGLYRLHLRQMIDARSRQQAPLIIPVGFGLVGRDRQNWEDACLPDQLLLTGASASFEFHLPAHQGETAPVPSLLRDFSAPVVLDYPFSPEDLACLALGDRDPFQRWEACQRLILSQLLPEPKRDAESLVLETLASVLADPELSDAFKAVTLGLPSEAFVAETWSSLGREIDPLAISHRLRETRLSLAIALRDPLDYLDGQLDLADQTPGGYRPDALSSGRRALRHLAQSLMTLIQPDAQRGHQLLQRFERADNMTSRMAALSSLVSLGGPSANAALQQFSDRYQDNALAMDKWFTVQVTQPREDDPDGLKVLGVVRGLLSDARYDAQNPNRVRSVLGAFFMQHLAGLHRIDGEGYRLWAEELGRLDERNGQLAARLARSLDRWRAYEPIRRALMQESIAQLIASGERSSDLREVCERLLQEPS